MSGAAQEVIVLAGRCGLEAWLQARLGASGCRRLDELLLDRACRCVEAAGAVPVTSPAEELPPILSTGIRPLLVLWPDLPRLRPGHVEAALEDLRAGCALAAGPTFDGGLYLVAAGDHQVDLPSLHLAAGDGELLTPLLAAGAAVGEVGMLRPERGLRRPDDVQAALADPLLEAPLREILQPCAGMLS